MEDEKLYTYYRLIKTGDLLGFKLAFDADSSSCEIMPYGQSLPQLAVLENQIDILEFLVDRGCDLNRGDKEHGHTPLHAAAQKGNLQATEILIASGSPIDIEDKYGNTPLSEAVFPNPVELPLIKLLLTYGADPFHKNKSNVSPYSFAEKTLKYDVIELFRSLD